ncbi:MAG TPA: hypothetical protein DCE43_20765 [Planctomycetaceae bacterium]|nr:hypothetical protein [Planctomycetaceae bacterium]
MTDTPQDKQEQQNHDPFDPARLRLTESAQIGVKKALTLISCGKPNRQQFVRVHPSEDYRMQTALFTDEVNQESYLVAPELWDELAGEIQPKYLFAAITKTTGNVFLWPVRVPDTDGRRNNWHLSAHHAAELAMEKWVRVQANMSDGKYDVFEATGDVPDPEWPELPFREMLKLCFKDRYIDSLDHPVLQSLRGEV